jgi:hypothetical protein
MGANYKNSTVKHATFSTAHWGLNQHCTEKSVVRTVSCYPYKNRLSQPLSEYAVVIIYTFARGYSDLQGGYSGCLACHMVLRRSALPLE